MSKVINVYKSDALYLEQTLVPAPLEQAIADRYTMRFYNEKACKQCEHAALRHSEEFCSRCPAFEDEVQLSGRYTIGKKPYIKAPLGDQNTLVGYLHNKGYSANIISKQPLTPKYPLKFIGELRDYQVGAPEALIRAKRGVLRAAARTGKTIMATAAICKVGRKTLILASQREWLEGFYDSFVGSQITQRMSNIPKSKIGFCKTLKDFESKAVCLATYQTFLSPSGKKLLQKIRSMFTTIVIDEVHTTAAYGFLSTLSKFNCRYMWGLTATDDRKDGRYVLVNRVLGKVCHHAKREVLRPKWTMVESVFRDTRANGQWPTLVRRLENDPKRLKQIAEWAVRDAAAGHVVLIPMGQVKPIKALTMAINKIAGSDIAHALTGTLQKNIRRTLVTDAQQGKVKVIVGTLKLLSVGLNIPPASCLYEVALSSNMPNVEQRISRILTPMEGKRQPIVRVWLDEYKVRKSCLRAEWFGKVEKHFNPIINDANRQKWLRYLNSKVGAFSAQRDGANGRALFGW